MQNSWNNSKHTHTPIHTEEDEHTMNQTKAKKLLKRMNKEVDNMALHPPKGMVGATVSVWVSELAVAGDADSKGKYRPVMKRERILLKQEKPASADYVMELQETIGSLMYWKHVEHNEQGLQTKQLHLEIHQIRIEDKVLTLDDENAEITHQMP